MPQIVVFLSYINIGVFSKGKEGEKKGSDLQFSLEAFLAISFLHCAL
jgi:hypothetical protein